MKTDIIQKVYGTGAQIYEEIMAKYWPAPRKEFIEALGFREGQRVLSAAVGTGLDLPYFPAGVHVIGIDITPEMLAEARKKQSPANVELIKMDIHELAKNFPKDYFDGVVSTFTFCVVPHPKEALEQIIEVTKPGAIIAFLDYCKSENPEIIKWQELFHPHAANIGFPMNVIVWNSLWSYKELIYHSGLPLIVENYTMMENPNPFLTACSIVLRNDKK